MCLLYSYQTVCQKSAVSCTLTRQVVQALRRISCTRVVQAVRRISLHTGCPSSEAYVLQVLDWLSKQWDVSLVQLLEEHFWRKKKKTRERKRGKKSTFQVAKDHLQLVNFLAPIRSISREECVYVSRRRVSLSHTTVLKLLIELSYHPSSSSFVMWVEHLCEEINQTEIGRSCLKNTWPATPVLFLLFILELPFLTRAFPKFSMPHISLKWLTAFIQSCSRLERNFLSSGIKLCVCVCVCVWMRARLYVAVAEEK